MKHGGGSVMGGDTLLQQDLASSHLQNPQWIPPNIRGSIANTEKLSWSRTEASKTEFLIPVFQFNVLHLVGVSQLQHSSVIWCNYLTAYRKFYSVLLRTRCTRLRCSEAKAHVKGAGPPCPNLNLKYIDPRIIPVNCVRASRFCVIAWNWLMMAGSNWCWKYSNTSQLKVRSSSDWYKNPADGNKNPLAVVI